MNSTVKSARRQLKDMGVEDDILSRLDAASHMAGWPFDGDNLYGLVLRAVENARSQDKSTEVKANG